MQENIERMRGCLRVLEDQTSFSTLAVDVTEAGAPKPEGPEKAGTLARARDDAVDGFMGVVSAVIVASGVLLPIAILALIVALLVRRLRPRFEREPASAPPPTCERQEPLVRVAQPPGAAMTRVREFCALQAPPHFNGHRAMLMSP